MARLEDIGRVFLDVTPSDTVNLSKGAADAFYVTVAGDLVLQGEDGDNATFAVSAATILPCGAGKVLATGTTATGIIAIYGRN